MDIWNTFMFLFPDKVLQVTILHIFLNKSKDLTDVLVYFWNNILHNTF